MFDEVSVPSTSKKAAGSDEEVKANREKTQVVD